MARDVSATRGAPIRLARSIAYTKSNVRLACCAWLEPMILMKLAHRGALTRLTRLCASLLALALADPGVERGAGGRGEPVGVSGGRDAPGAASAGLGIRTRGARRAQRGLQRRLGGAGPEVEQGEAQEVGAPRQPGARAGGV